MATISNNDSGRQKYEDYIQSFRVEISNVGAHMSIDSATRMAYDNEISKMSAQLTDKVAAGKMTWTDAASEAQNVRNEVMTIMRGRSTPVGLAIATKLKKEGKTLNDLVAIKTIKLFGKNAKFQKLTSIQKDMIYSAIVKSAGKSNPEITMAMVRISRVGRGLIFISFAVSIYTIMTSENKVNATKREFALTGAGIGGGMAGGALAGLVCGPGAPVCATIGAFVGGVVAAFGVDNYWN